MILNPAYWRARAAEIRTAASGIRSSKVKRIMIEIAEDYERLATATEATTAAEARRDPRDEDK